MMHIINSMSQSAISIAALGFLLPAISGPAPEEFWKIIDKLSTTAPLGVKAVSEIWPGKSLGTAIAQSKSPLNINTGPFDIGPGLQAKGSEIRIAKNDRVKLIIIRIEGNCITPSDIKQRYPLNKSGDFPQPNNPDPVSYRVVESKNLEISFGFRGPSPGCLTHVVFNPDPS